MYSLNYKDRRIILPKGRGVAFAPIQVIRADIDYNRHVNNANYIPISITRSSFLKPNLS